MPVSRRPRRPAAAGVETAAYFVVAEALANAGKHAGATGSDRASPRAATCSTCSRRRRARRRRPRRGLTGLRRRVEALDGTFAVTSPAGGPTIVEGGCRARRDRRGPRAPARRPRGLLRDNGFEVVAAVDDRDALVHAVLPSGPTSPSSTSACRRASATRGCAPPSSCAAVAGDGVLVVSQYVEQTYAAELLAGGAGRCRLPAQGPVLDVDEFVDAVRRVAGGGTALDPEVVAQLLARRAPSAARDAHARASGRCSP